jgi:hypothetical protein
VGGARILEGGAPWSEALLAAVKTWRFTPPPDDEVLSFRVEAEFVSGGGSRGDRRINLEATGLQRSGLLEESAPPSSPTAAAPTATAEAAPSPKAAPATGAEAAAPPAAPPPEKRPAPPADAAPAETAGTAETTPAAQTAPPAQAPSAPAQVARPAALPETPPAAAPPSGGTAAPPPVEVITAPPPPLPPENGVSAIRDVALDPGVPDLSRGRRPVAPPLARMAGTTGTVEVAFSVGGAGTTTVQGATGPDLLKPAAEQAVASWVFRRTRVDRAYLVAVFTFTGDKSSAVVRPQAAPPTGTTPPGASAPPPSPAPQQP